MRDRGTAVIAPLPSLSNRPPGVWGALTVSGEDLVVTVSGWRTILAVKRQVSVPLSCVIRVAPEPAARSVVRAKMRRRAGRAGLFRAGVYHSLDGWSFWSIGLGRNAVLVECSGARFRYLVVEVADPVATTREISAAAGLGDKAHANGRGRPTPRKEQHR